MRTAPLPLVLAATAVVGCALTRPARSVTPSGFLGPDVPLVEGGGDRALLVHRRDGIDEERYRRVHIEPVVAYGDDAGPLGRASEDDVRALLDDFDAALRIAVGDVIELADGPAEDVATLRVALTEARASRPLRGLTSTVMPYGRALSELKRLATGSHTAVGRAQVEFEVVDSMTGERLGAAVDARVGTKALRGVLDPWSDTKAAMDLWAQRIAARLSPGGGDAP